MVTRTRGVVRRVISAGLGVGLVDVAVVVAIGSVLVVVAVQLTSWRHHCAQTAEARSGVGAMAKGNIGQLYACRAYTPAPPPQLCESAPNSIPRAIDDVRGRKYASTEKDWTVASGDDSRDPKVGFPCLRFRPDAPQRYLFDYRAWDVRTGNDRFEAIAIGDLDGDGVTSSFVYRGQVHDYKVVLDPTIEETGVEE